MNILVLNPEFGVLRYAWFSGRQRERIGGGEAPDFPLSTATACSLDRCLETIADEGAARGRPLSADAIAIRVVYGGTENPVHAVADAHLMAALKKLAPRAPLHVPVVAALITASERTFGHVPVVLVFETAFFTALPEREYLYGLDPDLMNDPGIRRFGFHGLYHEAASRFAASRIEHDDARAAARIASICLDPIPEVSAVCGGRPLTVTSGATPLEGIPGHTTSGDVDPGIVITLSRDKGWGPEQINRVLTRRSGLRGMVGRPVTLNEVFTGKEAVFRLPREIVRYHILRACGAAKAAMSGIDRLVFSGRYAELGRSLGEWLAPRLVNRGWREDTGNVSVDLYNDSLERITADQAVAVLLRERIFS